LARFSGNGGTLVYCVSSQGIFFSIRDPGLCL
jgi:hypothetical protein